MQTGVYGEHCGDRASVDFFTNLGVDILICSNANHIPVAKLVSAQSHITGSPGQIFRHLCQIANLISTIDV